MAPQSRRPKASRTPPLTCSTSMVSGWRFTVHTIACIATLDPPGGERIGVEPVSAAIGRALRSRGHCHRAPCARYPRRYGRRTVHRRALPKRAVQRPGRCAGGQRTLINRRLADGALRPVPPAWRRGVHDDARQRDRGLTASTRSPRMPVREAPSGPARRRGRWSSRQRRKSVRQPRTFAGARRGQTKPPRGHARGQVRLALAVLPASGG